ncbi:MAG TPA: metal ABC transporter substrate-binding protein [Methylomirabilota bacterium]|jgi:ABC-type Zn uptake system ZnuABC Zn-binding protein ZnuA|nr:metal ABC transporter substrate-binding protein [Methylomirabilota bacterium]
MAPRLRALGLLAAIVALGVTALAGAADPPRMRVVATLPDLWSLTRAVAGDLVTVDVATRFGQNPHDLEIRPSQTLLIRRADVLVRNGLEEDAWIDPVVEGAGNPRLLRGSPSVIEASRGIRVLRVATGPVDRSMGDVHPMGNPHYTLDPANIPLVTANIVEGLTRVAPELGARLEEQRQNFLDTLAPAERRWRETLAPYRGARIVSYHDSWPYFYQAYGFVDGGVIEDRPGVPASPQHVAALVRRMREQGVKVVLLENWYLPDTANLVARQAGARVLALPQSPGAVKGTQDYIAHMDHLVRALAEALR